MKNDIIRFQKHEPIPEVLPVKLPSNREIVWACVGSDRSSGDALGPIVGTRLQEKGFPNVWGTLANPLHGGNMEETIKEINKTYDNPYIVAIDACLGNASDVGAIAIKNGPLAPGQGVGKTLPTIGDIHIIGIVNVGGFMEYFVLQNTRLYVVMCLADKICEIIHKLTAKRDLTGVSAA